MRRVVTEGYEKKILGVIFYSFYKLNEQTPVNKPEKVSFILHQLNGFIEKGVNLGKGLGPDWVETLGKYQIKYDQKQNRFVLTWRIPSLYSPEGDFNAPEEGRSLDYRW